MVKKVIMNKFRKLFEWMFKTLKFENNNKVQNSNIAENKICGK